MSINPWDEKSDAATGIDWQHEVISKKEYKDDDVYFFHKALEKMLQGKWMKSIVSSHPYRIENGTIVRGNGVVYASFLFTEIMGGWVDAVMPEQSPEEGQLWKLSRRPYTAPQKD